MSIIADTFNSLVTTLGAVGKPTTGGAIATSALVYTSTLRQLWAEKDRQALEDLANRTATEQSQFAEHSGFPLIVSSESRAQLRDAFNALITRKDSRLTTIDPIVGPTAIKFSQPKRFTRMDTFGGAKYLHFTDRRGFNNDVLTMAISGTTGMIDTRGLQSGDLAAGLLGLKKLITWLNLYWLTLEEKRIPETGQDNEVTITYLSKLLPQPIDFIGFFDKVMEWEDQGSEPFAADYTLSFVVQRMSPPMDEVLASSTELLAQRQAAINLSATALTSADGSA